MEALPKVENLADGKVNSLLHEAAGWKLVFRRCKEETHARRVWLNEKLNLTSSGQYGPSRYCDSLDAIHSIVKTLPPADLAEYRKCLSKVVNRSFFKDYGFAGLVPDIELVDAKARDRADALLVALQIATL